MAEGEDRPGAHQLGRRRTKILVEVPQGRRDKDKQAVKPKIVTPWVVSGKVHGAFEILGG